MTANAIVQFTKLARDSAHSRVSGNPEAAVRGSGSPLSRGRTEIGNGTMYIGTVNNGSFVVTHANNAQADRTFLYAALG